VLNPIRVFRNSFGGETLYQNPDYQSPNEVKTRFTGASFDLYLMYAVSDNGDIYLPVKADSTVRQTMDRKQT